MATYYENDHDWYDDENAPSSNGSPQFPAAPNPQPTAPTKKDKVRVFADGSCLGNPGAGGYAALVKYASSEPIQELYGGYRKTTNNRMEITAVLKALESLKHPSIVDVYTDSQYVCNAINENWLGNWINNNWRTSNRKPVKNRDLWEQLLSLLKKHQVIMHWQRGHNGCAENEWCDKWANHAAMRGGWPEDTGYLG